MHSPGYMEVEMDPAAGSAMLETVRRMLSDSKIDEAARSGQAVVRLLPKDGPVPKGLEEESHEVLTRWADAMGLKHAVEPLMRVARRSSQALRFFNRYYLSLKDVADYVASGKVVLPPAPEGLAASAPGRGLRRGVAAAQEGTRVRERVGGAALSVRPPRVALTLLPVGKRTCTAP